MGLLNKMLYTNREKLKVLNDEVFYFLSSLNKGGIL